MEMIEQVVEALSRTIKLRIEKELKPGLLSFVDKMIAEETAACALQISRTIEIKTMQDRIIIEVRMPKALSDGSAK